MITTSNDSKHDNWEFTLQQILKIVNKYQRKDIEKRIIPAFK
jgi:hypothetical protein